MFCKTKVKSTRLNGRANDIGGHASGQQSDASLVESGIEIDLARSNTTAQYLAFLATLLTFV
jgi:hypothetical protein